MFGISYETWKEICEMYFDIPQGSLKAYLQWFPFTKLSEDDKEKIKSNDFFDRYIDSGGFVMFSEVMRRSENFVQKEDGSFRNASLVSPLLFLVIQAIGKEVSYRYVNERPSDIEVYYAGNYFLSRAEYKEDYDDFFKSLNLHANSYEYFIKTDITSFFGNINVNKLIERINQICNKNCQRISQYQLLLLKELLLFCGDGEYPLIENSMASSYMATVIYLDEIDIELHRFIKTKVDDITDFRMIRYVDDLYILFSSNKELGDLKRTYNTIKNGYSSILKKYGLALNVGKCALKKCVDISESLKRSLYLEYVFGIKHDFGEMFEGKMSEFLSVILQHVSDNGITYEQYLELIEQSFTCNNIELPPLSVYNYFIYENQVELKKPETSEKLVRIIKNDISFLSIDPKRLSVMVMQSGNNRAIKAMLDQLFTRYRKGVWNSYDTTIAIAYLIQSKFQHIDLLNVLNSENPDLYAYYEYACRTSFLIQLRTDTWNRYLHIIGHDKKALFLYFMYLCEENRSNNLGMYAYYKNYFDRISADMAFKNGKDKGGNKPNYNRYFKEKTLKELYRDISKSDTIIGIAHKLRNQNPVCHSSAELVDNDSSGEDLKKSKSDLAYLIEQYSKQHDL